MKLTSNILKKLILEALREKYDYSSEEDENIKALKKYKAAGLSGVSQRIGKCLIKNKEYAKGKSSFSYEDRLCLEEQGFTKLGLGSFRIVFLDNQNKDRVIKLALDLPEQEEEDEEEEQEEEEQEQEEDEEEEEEEVEISKGMSMNLKEASLRLQTLSPMFPKVYSKHPHGIWIEVERVNIFKFKHKDDYFGNESWAPIKKFFPNFSKNYQKFDQIRTELKELVPDLITEAAGQKYTLDDIHKLLPFTKEKPLDKAFMIPDIHSTYHSIADKESAFVATWSLLIIGNKGLRGKSSYKFLYDNIISRVRTMVSQVFDPKEEQEEEEESFIDDEWFEDFVFENLDKNNAVIEEIVNKVENYLQPRLQSAYKLITSDRTYQELLRVHDELDEDFQLWDLRPDNLGSAIRNGKETLVLIDPGFDMDIDPRNR